ncbi:hypothetical protein [Caniella muris]|uniref:hypothetical protein n=1 Tax=Caniella muris TaxID=2941502 RepID=UPI002040D775|nr:hypothetical protein [Caniella muris]
MNNYNPADTTVKVTTPYGTCTGLAPGGNISSGVVGSRAWSRAICVGTTGSGVSVTYSGACIGSTATKTVTLR